jgi:hypothetical protein
MRGKPIVTLAACAALVCALPGTAAASCRWSAHLSAPTHHPKADRHWPVTVTTSLHHVRTSAYYAFVFSGRVVSTREIDIHHQASGKTRFHFYWRFRDPTVTWPKRSIGIPLTFRVVLRNRCGTKRLDYKVVVQR